MSAIDEIIARSRTPGTFVERRHFTLSREKAIEKLREFSLRHPRQYILELIQSAVFSGATYIAVDINRDRLLVAWVGGDPFDSTELESIFDYLFADRGEMSTRHLTQLAIGLNALLQRKPKLIRIESGNGKPGSTARMDLDKSGNGSLGIPEAALAGTYILVEYPSSWIPTLNRSSYQPEEGLIETRCLYVPVPVLLNGRAPFGYRASREIHLYGIRHQSSFDSDGRRGVIGLPGQEIGRAGRISREFRMVVGGVWISSLELPELGGPSQSQGIGALSGVICDDRLRKTADQSDIVQDRRYVEMLHAVQPVATQLIQTHHRKNYTPPSLPRIPDAEGGEEEQPAEPLPETIPQIGVRQSLQLDALSRLPANEPVFWVRPEDSADVVDSVDPLRFGQAILVLTPGQVISLELELPQLSTARLNNAADADFVRRVMERRQMLRLHSVPFRLPENPSVRGNLTLRFHAAGSMPRWGDLSETGTPVLISANERTLLCKSVPLPLQNVSVVLSLEDAIDNPADLLPSIIDAVVPEAWQLLITERVEGEALPNPDAETSLLAGVLGLNTYTYFVDESGLVELRLALPPAWDSHTAAFRERVLCTNSSRPLTLDNLLSLQSTGHTITLASPKDRERLESLEERLGLGHLVLADDDQHPLLAVRRIGGSWTVLKDNVSSNLSGPTLWVRPSLDPHWVPGASLHPALSQDSSPDDGPVNWTQGEEALLEALVALEEVDRWHTVAAATGHSVQRCRGMGQLAMLALALRHDRRSRVLRSAADTTISIDALLNTDSLTVAPLFGPSTQDEQTILLTYNQLRLMTEHGYQPRLQFDDAPEVWRSLSDASDPQWLIRQEVRAPGLRGWIGLRVPFDGSSGVLIQSVGSITAMPQRPEQAPCHGLVWVSGGYHRLSSAQLELLALARKQLYQRLFERIERMEKDHKAAGERYLSAYTSEQAPRRLAARQHGAQADPLNELQERLLAALPPGVGIRIRITEDTLGNRNTPLRITSSGVQNPLNMLLNPKHKLAKRAISDPRSTAAELLLLEMARRIVLWLQGIGVQCDLLEMHRVLVAQRVSAQAASFTRRRPLVSTEEA